MLLPSTKRIELLSQKTFQSNEALYILFYYLIKQNLPSHIQHNLGLIYFFVTTLIRYEVEGCVSEVIIWYQKSN